ncbi:MAG: hypothetical protein DRJ42_19435 [Deltaproteobacteria bacterium]|nr:MAG: hypothetical protein DRJ42_19435 [Deltaproteobacteria bacterium]
MRTFLRSLGVLTGLSGSLVCASCSGESEVGLFVADVYEGQVECTLDGQACLDEAGIEAPYETPSGFAFLTTETSQHHPDGLFVYFELERAGGIVGRGELDIPLGDEGVPTFAYTEERDGETVFVAEDARGVLEVPEEALGEDCECLDGRLELVFTDGAGDVIRLSRGRFGWEDRECIPRVRFTELTDELVVIPRSCNAVRRVVGPTESGSSVSWEDDRYPSESSFGRASTSSCGGAGSGCSGDGGGGCESDGGGCESGGGGCEGDTGGAGCAGDAGGSGCSGDAGGAGCAGDAGSCRVGGRRRVGPRGPQQTAVLVLLALAWTLRPRRYR